MLVQTKFLIFDVKNGLKNRHRAVELEKRP
jgi:hypothetical protein